MIHKAKKTSGLLIAAIALTMTACADMTSEQRQQDAAQPTRYLDLNACERAISAVDDEDQTSRWSPAHGESPLSLANIQLPRGELVGAITTHDGAQPKHAVSPKHVVTISRASFDALPQDRWVELDAPSAWAMRQGDMTVQINVRGRRSELELARLRAAASACLQPFVAAPPTPTPPTHLTTGLAAR